MSIIKKILIPFNFSEPSTNALNYALNFAKDKKEVELNLIHVFEQNNKKTKEEIQKQFEIIIEQFQKRTQSKIKSTIINDELLSGIINYQIQSKSDIILMGTQGSEGEESTITSQLIQKADCSVLVIPKTYHKFKLKRIAVSIDKEKIDDPKVLDKLLDTTRRFTAKVFALTILNESESYSEVDESNEIFLQYYLEKFYSHHSFLKRTDIKKGIFDYVKENKIDLLAILPRHHSYQRTPSEGKLVSVLVKHATVPLLILD
ncbi:MAG: universal stress protein [Flavobacteriaceae bacterium]|nr:universal stress protein [Flavobacteriaceae bacterium]